MLFFETKLATAQEVIPKASSRFFKVGRDWSGRCIVTSYFKMKNNEELLLKDDMMIQHAASAVKTFKN